MPGKNRMICLESDEEPPPAGGGASFGSFDYKYGGDAGFAGVFGDLSAMRAQMRDAGVGSR